MAGTTRKYKLPYPTQTDPVWQGATAIQSLAQRIETVLSAANIPTPPTTLDAADDPPTPGALNSDG